MPWLIFEQAASQYEAWYATPPGRRADQAERALLQWLLEGFPGARHVLEVGCGTGHFTAWLATQGVQALGLERAPAMLAEIERRFPHIPAVLGDAHQLPFRAGAVDMVVFVTALEFLEEPERALAEAVRVARRGVVVLALNRWSLGGFSRRWGRRQSDPCWARLAIIRAGSFEPWCGAPRGHACSECAGPARSFPTACGGSVAAFPWGMCWAWQRCWQRLLQPCQEGADAFPPGHLLQDGSQGLVIAPG